MTPEDIDPKITQADCNICSETKFFVYYDKERESSILVCANCGALVVRLEKQDIREVDIMSREELAYKGEIAWRDMSKAEKALVKTWGFIFGLMGASVGVIIGSLL